MSDLQQLCKNGSAKSIQHYLFSKLMESGNDNPEQDLAVFVLLCKRCDLDLLAEMIDFFKCKSNNRYIEHALASCFDDKNEKLFQFVMSKFHKNKLVQCGLKVLNDKKTIWKLDDLFNLLFSSPEMELRCAIKDIIGYDNIEMLSNLYNKIAISFRDKEKNIEFWKHGLICATEILKLDCFRYLLTLHPLTDDTFKIILRQIYQTSVNRYSYSYLISMACYDGLPLVKMMFDVGAADHSCQLSREHVARLLDCGIDRKRLGPKVRVKNFSLKESKK